MKTTHLVMIAALGLFGVASHASADTVTFTATIDYVYTYAYGYDYTYSGDTLTETTTYNLADPYSNNYDDPGYVEYSYGGSGYSDYPSSPVTSIFYSISGGGPSGSFDLSDAYGSEAYFLSPTFYQYGEQYTYGYGPQGYFTSDTFGSDVPQFGGATGPGVSTDIFIENFLNGQTIYASDSVSSGPTSAAPEPSTWALMLLGFVVVAHARHGKTKTRPNAPAPG